MSSVWNRLGFSSNPYDVRPLPASQEGADLLVGRDVEVKTILSQLRNTSLHPTLEGDNGVGKTSLVLVAGYKALEQRRLGQETQLFLPVKTLLQIENNHEEFERRALFILAQAFLDYDWVLKECGHVVPDMTAMKKWLNDPITKSRGGGFSILGNGVDGQTQSEINTSDGYSESGFPDFMHNALRQAFPTLESGGFIAVIDNLELLHRSNEAKRVLERIRDTSLSHSG